MLRALLLDLDGTLLDNPMDRFIPAYFQALTRWVADRVPPDALIRELLRATRAMELGDGSGPTNEETFAAHFYPALGVDRAELEPEFRRFYAEAFPSLQVFTRARPEARLLVGAAFAQGLDVVIATNPVFPRAAIEERLAWAGVGVDSFAYALVTCYEEMHATKSDPAYYHEILARIGTPAPDCLMVGDDWQWDMVTAATCGIPGFWVSDAEAPPTTLSIPLAGRGSLADVLRRLAAGTLATVPGA
ncbi:MAG: HAD family hydrolase [Acidobacteria bacterium]|nr:HAD family hydrolase [Acidobacteriota bacterium]